MTHSSDERHHMNSMLMRESLIDKDLIASTETWIATSSPSASSIADIPKSLRLIENFASKPMRGPNLG